MGSKPNQFKRRLLASSISSCMLASAGVYAQEAPILEEVIVTGIRASVEAAIDVKRESTGVVDAISAEDIGKMPDANLAESLQRIAGVSISRTNGEGSQVTVRGIDPAMNMVTVNGRVMPTVTNDGNVGDRASRAYDFGNLASETISGVEVYKTAKANVSGGGIGATVNLKTVRPLDVGDNKGTIGLKAVQDTTVFRGEGQEITPEISGLYNWVNDEENFGIALAASYQERDNVRSNAFVNNWQLRSFNTQVNPAIPVDAIPASAQITNAPADGTLFAIPTDIRYALEDNHRERTNAQLSLQYRPVDRVTATVDYLYSEYLLQADRSQQSTWFNESAISALTFDSGQDVLTPVIYTETYDISAGKDVSFAQQDYEGLSRSNSFGVNVAWDVTDSFQLIFDAHKSTAKNLTTQTELGLNANIVTGEYAEFFGDLPLMGITFNDSARGNGNGYLDGGDVSGAMGSARWDSQDAEIQQFKLDGALDLGQLAFLEDSRFQFGLDRREDRNRARVNDGQSPRVTMGNWGGIDPDAFGSDWPNYFDIRNFGDGFPDHKGVTSDPKFLSYGLDGDYGKIKQALENAYLIAQSRIKIIGDDPTTVDNPATPDEVENVEAYYWVTALDPNGEHWRYRDNNLNPDNFKDFVNGKIQPNGVVITDRTIEEEVTAVYLQFQGSFEIAGLESNLAVGLRYEDTEVTSSALVVVPAAQSWDGDNDWSLVYTPGNLPQLFVTTNSYDNFLPNIDFDISVTDDVKVRASYSHTMARPTYAQLSSATTINSQYLKQAQRGNPLLTPLESRNFDLSAEWYYSDDSYVSVAFFRKDVSDFIGTQTIQSEVYGLTDPRSGARFDAAIAAIEAKRANGELNRDGTVWDPTKEAHQHDQMLLNEGLNPADESTSIISDDRDPVQSWATTRPVNFREGKIDGIELSVTHWFGETGFGIQANYTAVDSDLSIDNRSTEEQFALLGVSDTANLIAFYDKNGLQARIAYNWRDKFLSSTTQGGNNAPGYTDAYAQLDFSVSYDITDSVTISAEGLNVTGEDYRVYGRSERQIFNFEDLGARYQVGVRYTF